MTSRREDLRYYRFLLREDRRQLRIAREFLADSLRAEALNLPPACPPARWRARIRIHRLRLRRTCEATCRLLYGQATPPKEKNA